MDTAILAFLWLLTPLPQIVVNNTTIHNVTIILAQGGEPPAAAETNSDCAALGDSRNAAGEMGDPLETSTDAERATGDACTLDALVPTE